MRHNNKRLYIIYRYQTSNAPRDTGVVVKTRASRYVWFARLCWVAPAGRVNCLPVFHFFVCLFVWSRTLPKHFALGFILIFFSFRGLWVQFRAMSPAFFFLTSAGSQSPVCYGGSAPPCSSDNSFGSSKPGCGLEWPGGKHRSIFQWHYQLKVFELCYLRSDAAWATHAQLNEALDL